MVGHVQMQHGRSKSTEPFNNPFATKISPLKIYIYYFIHTKKESSYFNFARSFSIMSRVIASRSYCGFQSHSTRAQVSSSLLGHDSAIA